MSPEIQVKLLQWFHTHQRLMPWRQNPSPYRVWISEVMLQQTTVQTVMGYFDRFIEHYPNLSDLACAEEQDVLFLWSGLGYYSRARNLLKTAQMLQEESQFPSSIQELKKLPGIGDYTAGAISSIAFNQADFLIDTNVERVIGRFFGLKYGKTFLNQVRFSAQELIQKLQQVPNEQLSEISSIRNRYWNQAIMEVGALLCSVRKVQCESCPLSSECRACLSGEPLNSLGVKEKPIITEIEEHKCCILSNNKLVLEKNIIGRCRGLYDLIIGSSGKKIGSFSYRISNNKVFRNLYINKIKNYQSEGNQVLVDLSDLNHGFPLTTPAKKSIKILLKHISNL